MKNPRDFQFAIFGKIVYTDHLIKELVARGFPAPVVIISPDEEYLRDERLLRPFGLCSDLTELAQAGKAKVYKLDNVNTDSALKILAEHRCNVGFSTSCRNIIRKMIIDHFKGEIFNIHDSYLPDERGGALNTWRILNGIVSVGDTIHYLDEGVDSGKILLQRRVTIKKKFPKPVDYLLAELDNCKVLLTRFVDLFMKNDPVPAFAQDNNKSLYYPRLYTEQNGIIDWDWPVEFAERFIRGFSTPYPGAYTYYNGKKIHIIEAHMDTKMRQRFHPFCNGKIVTVLDDLSVRVIAGGRAIILTQMVADGKTIRPGEMLSLKYTLHSPEKELELSKNYVPTTREMNIPEKNK